MKDNVVVLPVVTTLPIPVERVLEKAVEADLKTVVVLGYTQEGEEYFASSISDGGEVNWLMDRLKLQLLNVHPR
jgi:hypothetical protein